jgi:hypothetical protein
VVVFDGVAVAAYFRPFESRNGGDQGLLNV